MSKSEPKHMTVVNLDALKKLVDENEAEHDAVVQELQNKLDTAVQQYNLVIQLRGKFTEKHLKKFVLWQQKI